MSGSTSWITVRRLTFSIVINYNKYRSILFFTGENRYFLSTVYHTWYEIWEEKKQIVIERHLSERTEHDDCLNTSVCVCIILFFFPLILEFNKFWLCTNWFSDHSCVSYTQYYDEMASKSRLDLSTGFSKPSSCSGIFWSI